LEAIPHIQANPTIPQLVDRPYRASRASLLDACFDNHGFFVLLPVPLLLSLPAIVESCGRAERAEPSGG